MKGEPLRRQTGPSEWGQAPPGGSLPPKFPRPWWWRLGLVAAGALVAGAVLLGVYLAGLIPRPGMDLDRPRVRKTAQEVGCMESGFYEEDEPIEKIAAILAREPDGVTAPPDETDLTLEDLKAMWAEAEPAEVVESRVQRNEPNNEP